MMNVVPGVEKVASPFNLIHNEPGKPYFAEITLAEEV